MSELLSDEFLTNAYQEQLDDMSHDTFEDSWAGSWQETEGATYNTQHGTIQPIDEEYLAFCSSGFAQLQDFINSEPNTFDNAADVSPVDGPLDIEAEEAFTAVDTADDVAIPDPQIKTVYKSPAYQSPSVSDDNPALEEVTTHMSSPPNHGTATDSSVVTSATAPDDVTVNVKRPDTPDLHSDSEPHPELPDFHLEDFPKLPSFDDFVMGPFNPFQELGNSVPVPGTELSAVFPQTLETGYQHSDFDNLEGGPNDFVTRPIGFPGLYEFPVVADSMTSTASTGPTNSRQNSDPTTATSDSTLFNNQSQVLKDVPQEDFYATDRHWFPPVESFPELLSDNPPQVDFAETSFAQQTQQEPIDLTVDTPTNGYFPDTATNFAPSTPAQQQYKPARNAQYYTPPISRQEDYSQLPLQQEYSGWTPTQQGYVPPMSRQAQDPQTPSQQRYTGWMPDQQRNISPMTGQNAQYSAMRTQSPYNSPTPAQPKRSRMFSQPANPPPKQSRRTNSSPRPAQSRSSPMSAQPISTPVQSQPMQSSQKASYSFQSDTPVSAMNDQELAAFYVQMGLDPNDAPSSNMPGLESPHHAASEIPIGPYTSPMPRKRKASTALPDRPKKARVTQQQQQPPPQYTPSHRPIVQMHRRQQPAPPPQHTGIPDNYSWLHTDPPNAYTARISDGPPFPMGTPLIAFSYPNAQRTGKPVDACTGITPEQWEKMKESARMHNGMVRIKGGRWGQGG